MLSPDIIRKFLIAAASSFLLAGPVAASSYDDALNSARMGDTRLLVDLLSRGIDPNTVDSSGNTLLIIAAREGNAETVAALVAYRPRLDYRNLTGDSALMLAALQGHEKVVDVLLNAGAPFNHSGWTPLHYAAFEGRLAVVERLLRAGADLNLLAPNQSDALMLAARNGHIDVVRKLIEAGSVLDRKNDAGLTAEEWARSRGNTDIADLIAKARKAR